MSSELLSPSPPRLAAAPLDSPKAQEETRQRRQQQQHNHSFSVYERDNESYEGDSVVFNLSLPSTQLSAPARREGSPPALARALSPDERNHFDAENGQIDSRSSSIRRRPSDSRFATEQPLHWEEPSYEAIYPAPEEPDNRPLCRNYLAGRCKHGASCINRHQLPELDDIPEATLRDPSLSIQSSHRSSFGMSMISDANSIPVGNGRWGSRGPSSSYDQPRQSSSAYADNSYTSTSNYERRDDSYGGYSNQDRSNDRGLSATDRNDRDRSRPDDGRSSYKAEPSGWGNGDASRDDYSSQHAGRSGGGYDDRRSYDEPSRRDERPSDGYRRKDTDEDGWPSQRQEAPRYIAPVQTRPDSRAQQSYPSSSRDFQDPQRYASSRDSYPERRGPSDSYRSPEPFRHASDSRPPPSDRNASRDNYGAPHLSPQPQSQSQSGPEGGLIANNRPADDGAGWPEEKASSSRFQDPIKNYLAEDLQRLAVSVPVPASTSTSSATFTGWTSFGNDAPAAPRDGTDDGRRTPRAARQEQSMQHGNAERRREDERGDARRDSRQEYVHRAAQSYEHERREYRDEPRPQADRHAETREQNSYRDRDGPKEQDWRSSTPKPAISPVRSIRSVLSASPQPAGRSLPAPLDPQVTQHPQPPRQSSSDPIDVAVARGPRSMTNAAGWSFDEPARGQSSVNDHTRPEPLSSLPNGSGEDRSEGRNDSSVDKPASSSLTEQDGGRNRTWSPTIRPRRLLEQDEPIIPREEPQNRSQHRQHIDGDAQPALLSLDEYLETRNTKAESIPDVIPARSSAGIAQVTREDREIGGSSDRSSQRIASGLAGAGEDNTSLRPSESASNISATSNGSPASHLPAPVVERSIAQQPAIAAPRFRSFKGADDSSPSPADARSAASSPPFDDNPNAIKGGWDPVPVSRKSPVREQQAARTSPPAAHPIRQPTLPHENLDWRREAPHQQSSSRTSSAAHQSIGNGWSASEPAQARPANIAESRNGESSRAVSERYSNDAGHNAGSFSNRPARMPSAHDAPLPAPTPRRYDSGPHGPAQELERVATPKVPDSQVYKTTNGVYTDAPSRPNTSGLGAVVQDSTPMSIKGASAYQAEVVYLKEELSKMRSRLAQAEARATPSQADDRTKQLEAVLAENVALKKRVADLEDLRKDLRTAILPVLKLLNGTPGGGNAAKSAPAPAGPAPTASVLGSLANGSSGTAHHAIKREIKQETPEPQGSGWN